MNAGQEKRVTVTLGDDAFSYYNTAVSDWHVESGTYEILVGASSRDIRLSQGVEVKENRSAPIPDERKRLPEYYDITGDTLEISAAQFELLCGRPLPMREKTQKQPYHINTRLEEISDTLVGKLFNFIINREIRKMADKNETDTKNDSTFRMMQTSIRQMPIRAIGLFGGDIVPKYTAEAIVCLLNGQLFKGIQLFLKK